MNEKRRARFQVTMKDLALATALFGFSLGLWLFEREAPLVGYRFALVYGAIVSFGAGVGSIFGRPVLGATVGLFLIPAAPVLFVVFGP